MSDFNRRIIDEFRANEGRVGPPFEGWAMVLLTTTGAKSGDVRTHPLARFDVDGRRFVVGSNSGRDAHPAWVHNVRANPEVTVEDGAETYRAVATPVDASEYERLFAAVVAMRPVFGEYQDQTDRVLPLVELIRS